jgi:hypothetical protein
MNNSRFRRYSKSSSDGLPTYTFIISCACSKNRIPLANRKRILDGKMCLSCYFEIKYYTFSFPESLSEKSKKLRY